METPHLFERGTLVATRAALESLGMEGVLILAGRHFRLDPGALCPSDARLNKQALRDGSRIFSAYDVDGVRYFVITDGTDDAGRRASTTVMEANDY